MPGVSLPVSSPDREEGVEVPSRGLGLRSSTSGKMLPRSIFRTSPLEGSRSTTSLRDCEYLWVVS
jgi:hypothetical protein